MIALHDAHVYAWDRRRIIRVEAILRRRRDPDNRAALNHLRAVLRTWKP